MIRHRGDASHDGNEHEERLLISPAEIGRALREAREERGLDLITVHDRIGRPITAAGSARGRRPHQTSRSGLRSLHRPAVRPVPHSRRRCVGAPVRRELV